MKSNFHEDYLDTGSRAMDGQTRAELQQPLTEILPTNWLIPDLGCLWDWWSAPSGGRFHKRIERRFGSLLGGRIAAAAEQ